MEEVLSNLAHDATSNKVKTVRDACISATGKPHAIDEKQKRKTEKICRKKLALISLVFTIFFCFQMACSSVEMEREKFNPTSSGKI